MKKIVSVLLMLCMFASCALAESPAIPFSCEYFSLSLPEGMMIPDQTAVAGYEAAVQSDFPDAAQTLLTAVNADHSKAVNISVFERSKTGPLGQYANLNMGARFLIKSRAPPHMFPSESKIPQ